MSEWTPHLYESREVFAVMDGLGESIDTAATILINAAKAKRIILVCGNGGSAADSMHFAAELTGRYGHYRSAVKCMALCADAVFITAWSNDYQFNEIFARQIEAWGERGGVLMALTTSGKSSNVLMAVDVAQKLDMKVIALTGINGLHNHKIDATVSIPSTSTPLIQQGHIIVYHYLAKRIEEAVCG